ncbi:hypothetical protein [Niastella sp. OAS944]|uniref:hypothetical protein n=1 Tax=Niastella sp. OAS944 TaxID=2664089 RepID=UPI00347944A9|nr:hypothetical protein [Chitinophagaceae bacterium OAS944]
MSDKSIVQPEAGIASAHAGIGGLRPGTIQLTFKEGIVAKSVHESLDRIFKLHGCIGCGLLGIDLRLRIEDPIFSKLRDIDGLIDATIFR